MKTFDDLVFKTHRVSTEGVKAVLDLGNDIEVSVVGGPNMYGDGITTFEVAGWYKTLNRFVPLDGSDISGWKTKDEVTEIINKLENL